MCKISAAICLTSVLWLLLLIGPIKANIRRKRLLTFPPQSPTRIQLIMGIGIPVELRIESVTIGYVLKAEYFLPENVSNYLNYIEDPFDVTTRPLNTEFDRKRREMADPNESIEQLMAEPYPAELPIIKNQNGFDNVSNEQYEIYQVPAIEVEADKLSMDDYWSKMDAGEVVGSPMRAKGPQNLGESRWNAYKTMAILADLNGLNGRICVLRSICESAHVPFDYSNGIMGELLHIVMTPSSTEDELRDHSDNEYLRAEELGKYGAPCEQIFKECSKSILAQFSGIYTAIKDISKLLG